MLPRVILHNAVSADGRIDWFNPDIGQFYEIASHWQEDATLAGSDTILVAGEEAAGDNEGDHEPAEKKADDSRPLLVIPDSRGRVRNWGYWKKQPYWRNAVALCSQSTPQGHLDYLEKENIDYIVAGDDHVDLMAALEELNRRYGVRLIRVDSGGTLNGVLLRAGLVDEVSLLICPGLVGGTTPRSFFRAADLTSAEGVIGLRLLHSERLKNDVIWLRYAVVK
ncbi:MAG: RibD family protein [Dehalococcoidales bacterium]|nr:MAG: RibD family protein [Dehalococcoidales bacterium]